MGHSDPAILTPPQFQAIGSDIMIILSIKINPVTIFSWNVQEFTLFGSKLFYVTLLCVKGSVIMCYDTIKTALPWNRFSKQTNKNRTQAKDVYSQTKKYMKGQRIKLNVFEILVHKQYNWNHPWLPCVYMLICY